MGKGDDDDGGFSVRPDVEGVISEKEDATPSFADLTHVTPLSEDLDPQLGGGAPDMIWEALQHYADDDAILPGLGNGVMLAQGAPPAQVDVPVAEGVSPARTPGKSKRAAKQKAKSKAIPKKQRDDWSKVEATTDGKPGGYDIGWMKNVDPRVLKSIDGKYADDIADAAVANRVSKDGRIKKIDASREQAVANVRAANKTTKKKGAKELPEDPVADAVESAWDIERAAIEFQIRTELENSATKSAPKHTVSDPEKGTRKVRRADMQTLKRANYVADVNSLSGDPEKTRKHLESFRAVKGTDMRKRGGKLEKDPGAMMLSGDTADRFEAARGAFEGNPKHKGFTMPTTSVGYGTRGLHEEERGLGYLGHMLGTTFDLHAVENPNLDGPGNEGPRLNSYMLRKFGRDRTTNKLGRTMTDGITDAEIQAMGYRTANKTGTPKEVSDDGKLETKVREQYREMSATSQRFKGDNSLGKEGMDQLRAKRIQYLALVESRKKEAALATKLGASPDDADLKQQLKALQDANSISDDEIRNVMKDQFGPWQQELQDDMEKTRNDTTHDDAYNAKELATLQATHDNFSNPERVFGRDDPKKKGLQPKDEVTNVPIMQYLEKGFIRDDGTDYENAKKGAVFNEDVFATLVRYGFGPGSSFGDTMHFDFLESQANLVPGGRNTINMKANRASADKDLPDATPPPRLMERPHPLAPPPRAPSIVEQDPHPLAWPKHMFGE